MIKAISCLDIVSVDCCVFLSFFFSCSHFVVVLLHRSFFSKIQWDSRLTGAEDCECKVSVDGSEFAILEPTPFNRKWYSHKINGAELCHEVAILVVSAEIIWVSGPYPAGEWSDLRIMRDGLVFELLPREKVIADRSYHDGRTFTVTPTDGDSEEEKTNEGDSCTP